MVARLMLDLYIGHIRKGEASKHLILIRLMLKTDNFKVLFAFSFVESLILFEQFVVLISEVNVSEIAIYIYIH